MNVTHSKVSSVPANPVFDITTDDWNATHVIAGMAAGRSQLVSGFKVVSCSIIGASSLVFLSWADDITNVSHQAISADPANYVNGVSFVVHADMDSTDNGIFNWLVINP